MSQISIIGSSLYQWEKGRQLKVMPLAGMRVDSVQFSNYGDSVALVVKPKEENGAFIADIPNILLQDDQNIVVYSVNVSGDKVETLRECVFPVRKRAKPTDYVYTETEILSYSTLDKRIADLEKGGVSDEKLAERIENYLTENPPESGLDEEAVAEIVKEKTADFARIHPEKAAPKETTGQFVYDIESGTIMCDGNRVYIGFPFKATNGVAPFAVLPSENFVYELIHTAIENAAPRFGDGIIYDGWNTEKYIVDPEYVKGLVMPAVNGKQDAFQIGDGLKLVDGVLSLNLDTWQGGAY